MSYSHEFLPHLQARSSLGLCPLSCFVYARERCSDVFSPDWPAITGAAYQAQRGCLEQNPSHSYILNSYNMDTSPCTGAASSDVPPLTNTTAAGVDPSVPEYRHEPFPNKGDWIRVLHLRPSQDRIEFSLEQVKHTDGGYQALSYAWGHLETVSDAFVVDAATGATVGRIPLTKNLHNALRDLKTSHGVGSIRPRAYAPVGCFPTLQNSINRSGDAEDTEDGSHNAELTLWIDQICIDQEIMEEKNHQVSMMASIYSNASRVITYFGPACEDSVSEERGMQVVGQVYEHFAAELDDHADDPFGRAGSTTSPLSNTVTDEEYIWLARLLLSDCMTRYAIMFL